MKLFYVLIILTIFCGCSFDNKSGIWDNSNISDKENKLFKDFKEVSISSDQFNEIITIKDNYKFKLSPPIKNLEWKDFFYNQYNNSKNFNYNTNNKSIFKSNKLSKFNTKKYILIENNNLILNDFKGNIIIYSINENKIISKFNFYKKKYKKIDKKLNLIIENNIIYVSDNFGYLYAYNYFDRKLLWAKNYNIPFRSNLKIYKNTIFAANQNNNLYILDKNSGGNLKLLPTEETIIKNNFINNLSTDGKDLYFLNTYGSLYSIDIDSRRINWFINLNQSLELNPSNLFFGNLIVLENSKIVVSSNNFTYVLDSKNGSIIYDLAAVQGGNTAFTKVDEIVDKNGVKIMGESNILNKLPTSASNLYAKNVFNFVSNLYDKENKKININLDDEIIEKTLIK